MRGLVLTIERRATAVQRAGVRGLRNRVDGPVHDDEGREAALEQGAHVPTHKLCQHPRPWSLSALHHFPHPSCAQRPSPVEPNSPACSRGATQAVHGRIDLSNSYLRFTRGAQNVLVTG